MTFQFGQRDAAGRRALPPAAADARESDCLASGPLHPTTNMPVPSSGHVGTIAPGVEPGRSDGASSSREQDDET